MPWEVAAFIGEAIGGGEAAAATAEAIAAGSAGEAAAGLTAGELAAAEAAASGGLMGAEVLGSGVGSGVLTTGMTDAASKSLIQQLATYTGLSTAAIERLGGAAISSLASMYGAGKLGQASMDAANRLATANQSATQLQSQMYQDTMSRTQPFYQEAVNALPDYITGIRGTKEQQAAGQPGSLVRPFDVTRDYTQSPWYQYSLDKTLKDYTNKLASMGRVDSGPMRRGVVDIAKAAGQEDIMNAYNRYNADLSTRRGALGNLVGFAAPANAMMTTAGTNYADATNALNMSTAGSINNANLSRASAYGNAGTGIAGGVNAAMTPNPINQMMASWMQKQTGA